MRFEKPIPILRIFDEAKAREFYVGFLGFSVDWEHRFAPDLPLYLQVSRGDCVLHLSEHYGDATPGGAIRIGTSDLADFHAELAGKQHKYARPGIDEQPWGKDMSVKDPFGNRLTFTSVVTTSSTTSQIGAIAPFFIVKSVPASLSFYRDRLGFDITFQGPEPDDIFFGIVERGAAMIMLKSVGVDPVPNYTRDIKQGIARWDAYLYVPDPDALAEEFSSRGVEFSRSLQDDDDGLRGFELKDADGYVLFFGRPR